MQMTEKDKKLLVILAVIVVLFVFIRFIFVPLGAKNADLEDKIATAELEKEKMDLQLQTLPLLKMQRIDLEEQFKGAAEDYYDILQLQEIDKLVTDIVLSCGLEPLAMEMKREAEALEIEPYVNSEMAGIMAAAPAPETESQTENANAMDMMMEAGPQAELPTPQGVVKTADSFRTATAKLTVKGTKRQTEELIDKLANDYPAIRVTSFEKKSEEKLDEETNKVIKSGEYTLKVELTIYMCDQMEMEAQKGESDE